MEQTPAASGAPNTPAQAPASSPEHAPLSAEDQAFVDSYKSYADELDAAQNQPAAPLHDPMAGLSPEERELAESYKPYADELDQPSQTPTQTDKPADYPSHQISDEETRIRQLRQQVQPAPGMHYTIDNEGIRQAADETAAAPARAELQTIERQRAAEARASFMEWMHTDLEQEQGEEQGF